MSWSNFSSEFCNRFYKVGDEIMAQLSVCKGTTDTGVYLNSTRITRNKVYGLISSVQTWKVDYYDVLDAIPIDVIKDYLSKRDNIPMKYFEIEEG